MIASIELKGFQSHLHTKIDFRDGVNILVGPSRNGKTAVLRALRWLTDNRPIGIDGFITHGQKEISVALKLDNHTIVRKKNSKENVYILDGEKFAGIGSNVPAPVTKLLNFSDLNIASQFDQPYLLFDSPGQVAQQLNAVVHLEKIDSSLAAIASLKRQNDQDIRSQEARVTGLDELLAEFPDLEAAEAFIEGLEKLQKDYDLAKQEKAMLESIQTNLAGCRYNLTIIELPDWVEPKAAQLSAMNSQMEQKEYTTDALHRIQTELAKARLDSYRLGTIVQHEARVSQLLAESRGLESKQKTLGRLRTYATTLGIQRERFDRVAAIIKAEDARFQKMFPEVCPLCEQPIRK